ncbi:transposase [Micromonospora arborensis]|uniref:transposase n=1 Tax=Micromonospora arborensis TaxID=2116518 RepID=UPI0033F8D28D
MASTRATLADHLPTSIPRNCRSDTSDAEWVVLAPHVPAGSGRGRPIVYPRRDVVDTVRYLDRTGCQWDALPADFRTRNSSTPTSRPGRPTAPLPGCTTICVNRSASSRSP